MGKHSAFAGSAALLVAASLAAPALAADPPGKEMYMANCSACHRPDGAGVKGAFPALAGNAFVAGPKTHPLMRVLNGRGGMPAFKTELSDQQLAAILTYVRSSWGNKADAVKPADVAAVRSGPGPAQVRSLQAH
ncbi:cytochrome c [Phenylobacterium sp. LjRoot219]|uniref:c-type cytochrome n=1 Tax=Phenylobacterium sp. LjRoot219 TaxID=3342283 RepID=UPI003ECE12CE